MVQLVKMWKKKLKKLKNIPIEKSMGPHQYVLEKQSPILYHL